jgi:hypothetical protein
MVDTIKSGNSLLQTSKEEIQNLAANKGLRQTPVTPLAGSALGASPDQSKMMGSKVQKQAAFGQPTQQAKTVTQVERTEQVRSAESEAEQSATQKAAQLNQLGSLGTRVQQLIEHNLWSKAQTDAAAQAQNKWANLQVVGTPDTSAYTNNPNFDAATFRTKLEEYSYDQNPETLAEINVMLGRNPNTVLSDQDILSFYQQGSEAVGTAVAAQSPDNIFMADVDPTTLGFADDSELASLLGITREQLSTMSLTDLTNAVKSEQDKEFNRVEQMKAKLNDPNLGAAEREQIQRELGEASQVGVTGVEQEVGQTAQSVEQAEFVKGALNVEGKDYKVSDLLSDTGIKDIINTYLGTDPLYSDWRKDLEGQSPEFVAWMKQNEANLKKEVAETVAGVGELKGIQDANVGLQSTKGGAVDEGAMKAIYGDDWGKVLGHKLTASPVLELANDESGSNPGMVVETLNKASKVDPNIAKEMGDLSKDELKKIGIDNPSKHPSANDYIQQKADAQKLKTISDTDADAMLDMLFGEDVQPQQVQQTSSLLSNYSKLLGGPSANLPFDQDNDGQVDDPATIKSKMQSYLNTNANTLKDVVAGAQPGKVTGQVNSGSLSDRVREINSDPIGKLANKVQGNQLVGVTAADLKNPSGGLLDVNTLEKMWSGLKVGMDDQSRSAIRGELSSAGRREIDQAVTKQYGNVGVTSNDVKHIDDIVNKYNSLQSLANQAGKYINNSNPRNDAWKDWSRSAVNSMNELDDAIVKWGGVADAEKLLAAGRNSPKLSNFVAQKKAEQKAEYDRMVRSQLSQGQNARKNNNGYRGS